MRPKIKSRRAATNAPAREKRIAMERDRDLQVTHTLASFISQGFLLMLQSCGT